MTASRYRYLMCRPEHFQVSYVINPWMKGNLNRASRDQCHRQWKALYRVITAHAEVRLIPPRPGLPDMTFTANAGFVLNRTAAVSRFAHPERQGEERWFEQWFAQHGYRVMKTPTGIPFEGAGDALLDRKAPRIWAGYGQRSSRESHRYLSRWFGLEVISLKLVDSRFYHLDTCFCPLEGGAVMYFPNAFDERSRRMIEEITPLELRIAVPEADAADFVCNAVNIGGVAVVNRASPQLISSLARIGFTVVQVAAGEFLKGGGSVKCLTLRLNEPLLRPASRLASRTANACSI